MANWPKGLWPIGQPRREARWRPTMTSRIVLVRPWVTRDASGADQRRLDPLEHLVGVRVDLDRVDEALSGVGGLQPVAGEVRHRGGVGVELAAGAQPDQGGDGDAAGGLGEQTCLS